MLPRCSLFGRSTSKGVGISRAYPENRGVECFYGKYLAHPNPRAQGNSASNFRTPCVCRIDNDNGFGLVWIGLRWVTFSVMIFLKHRSSTRSVRFSWSFWLLVGVNSQLALAVTRLMVFCSIFKYLQYNYHINYRS